MMQNTNIPVNVLEFTLEYLMKKCNLEKDYVLNMQREMAEKTPCYIECRASELNNLTKIITPFISLNDLTNGGLLSGTVTELVGPPGSGKSQFCMSLVAKNIIGINSKNIIYVDTNGSFSFNRFFQILNLNDTKLSNDSIGVVLSKLHFFHPQSKNEFYDILTNIKLHIEMLHPGIIVIDCIAYFLRAIKDMKERSCIFTKIISVLKKVAAEHNITVVLVNQITGINDENCMLSSALGKSWSHYVNTRIYFDMSYPPGQFSEHSINRQALLLKSSFAFNFSIPFRIDTSGVYDLTNRDLIG